MTYGENPGILKALECRFSLTFMTLIELIKEIVILNQSVLTASRFQE